MDLSPRSRRILPPGVLCRPRFLTTLAILLGCLSVAAAVTVVADQRWKRTAVLGGRRKRAGSRWCPRLRPTCGTLQRQRPAQANSRTRRAAGSEAPDFTLPDAAGRRVTLSSFRGKRPVVLVFGSFGCDLYCNQLAPLRRMYEAFQGRIEFLFVYTSEVPHGSTPLPRALRPIPPPGIGAEARWRRIRWYQEESGGSLPWLLDGAGRGGGETLRRLAPAVAPRGPRRPGHFGCGPRLQGGVGSGRIREATAGRRRPRVRSGPLRGGWPVVQRGGRFPGAATTVLA